MEHVTAVLQAPTTVFFVLAAGSLQRAFPEPQTQPDKVGGGVSATGMPEGIVRDPGPPEMRQIPSSTGGTTSELELPQPQAASAAQVQFAD